MKDTSPPLISVVVPCYNQAEYLPETLESLLSQTYENWECIIVNDGSPDNSEEIAKLYCNQDSRFRYHKKQNGGLSSARNAGIRLAKGSFIQLLDSDDLLEMNKLKNAVHFYQSSGYDNSIIVYSGMRYFENSTPDVLQILGRDNFIGHIEMSRDDSAAVQLSLIKTRNLCVISAPLYPRTAFDDSMFDEELKAHEDWDLHLRFIKKGLKFHCISGIMGSTLVRLHEKSMMRNPNLLFESLHKLSVKHNLQLTNDNKKTSLKTLVRIITPPVFFKIYESLLAYKQRS